MQQLLQKTTDVREGKTTVGLKKPHTRCPYLRTNQAIAFLEILMYMQGRRNTWVGIQGCCNPVRSGIRLVKSSLQGRENHWHYIYNFVCISFFFFFFYRSLVSGVDSVQSISPFFKSFHPMQNNKAAKTKGVYWMRKNKKKGSIMKEREQ